MITLSTELLNNLQLTVTNPGYLVRIGYSTPLYLSTIRNPLGDNISWNGHTWYATSMTVTGVSQDGSAKNNASISLGNIGSGTADTAYSTIVLDEGAADIPIEIYIVYTGSVEPKPVFTGVTDGADISLEKVIFTLSSSGNNTLFSPRKRIGKPLFNFLQAEGTEITIGTEKFILERA